MATTQDYINQLKIDKQNLVSMLNGMGVEASNNETFTSLTPKVGKIVTDPILQDKTITITENGTTNIVADEGYDGLYNVSVTTNVGGTGTDNINLFIQNEEPEEKNGIWVKTNELQNTNKLNIIGNEISIDLGDWNPQGNYEQLPYDYALCSTAIIGTDIFIFFNQTVSGVNATYKYDTINNTYTRLSDVPFDSSRGSASAIGTDIYIFGSSVSPNNQAYKYDTLTDTYTKLTNIPYNAINVTTVAYKNSVYLFGGQNNYNAYRYDVATNSYTKLKDMTIGSAAGRAVLLGDSVYMFGIGGYTDIQKYNISANTYSKIGTTALGMARCLPVACGDYIFVIGSSSNDTGSKTIYIFDTINNKIIKTLTIPYQFGQGGGGLIGNKLYLMGSRYTNNMKRVQTVNVAIPEFSEDSIILSSIANNQYKTKLSNVIECGFNNCYIYSKENSILPTNTASIYYGDGSKWTKL